MPARDALLGKLRDGNPIHSEVAVLSPRGAQLDLSLCKAVRLRMETRRSNLFALRTRNGRRADGARLIIEQEKS